MSAVTMADALVNRLSELDEDEFVALLDRRPDVLFGAELRDLADLAQRMRNPQSLATVMRAGALPCLQLAEAAQVLGDRCTRAALAKFLEDSGPHHRADIDQVVDELIADAVFSEAHDGRIELPDAFAELFPSPLGLGEPLRLLLHDCTVDAMRKIQTTLGLDQQKNRADTAASLISYFGDVDKVRAILAGTPAEMIEFLTPLAQGRPYDDEEIFGQREYEQQRRAINWAAARGLIYRDGYGWQMPAEVTRAFRESDYHAPFTPQPPEPVTRAVDRTRVETDSSAAATQFADHVLAVLDHIARAPVASVKSGGVGTRELTKLAKATAAGQVEARLALELADAAGLLDRVGQTVAVSDDFTAWRDADPADRFVELLSAWWELGSTPTQTMDCEGKTLPALASPEHCAGCRAARVQMIETLAELDGATDRASVAQAAWWRQPFVHIPDQDGDEPFVTVWREAEMLGVISQDALSKLGSALLVGNSGALRTHAASLLPESADHARFGADLTVYVAGAPSARVSALLDSAATREGRGGAVTWRFSPTSVRRALDEGTTGEALTKALTEIATAELPQPLRYLIADVARRHGNLQLTAVTSCVLSDDAALLAEVAADRKLAKLGLRLLAPTVLASDATVDKMLAALRASGYFPIPQDTAGNVVQLSSRRHSAVDQVPDDELITRLLSRTQIRDLYPEPKHPDPRAVAARLLHHRTLQT